MTASIINLERYFLGKQMDAEIARLEADTANLAEVTARVRRLLDFAEPFHAVRKARIEARLQTLERAVAEQMPSDSPYPGAA